MNRNSSENRHSPLTRSRRRAERARRRRRRQIRALTLATSVLLALIGVVIADITGVFAASNHALTNPMRFQAYATSSSSTATATTSVPMVSTASGRAPRLAPASAGTNPSSAAAEQQAAFGQGSSASGSSGPLTRGSAESFGSFRASQPGEIGIALEPLGTDTITELGDQAPAHAWSTSKVPVLATLIKARGSAGLTETEQAEANLAITESDNQSILDLFGDLETIDGGLISASDAVDGLLRASGDDVTTVATAPPPAGAVTTFGQTEWAPRDAVKFFKALTNGCLLKPSQSSYVLGLMQHIVPSESWGLGSAGLSHPVAYKDGWGPEGNAYLVRQSGIVDPGSPDGVSVAIVAYPPAGSDSFEIGTEMVTATARWLASRLKLGDESSRSSC